jgi:SAM-dependent methyltransferase
LDPDAEMLAEAARYADRAGADKIVWIRGLAEEIPSLDLGTFRLVTFGQSFHRTDQERVAEAVYDHLDPGGSIVLLAHTIDHRPEPAGPDYPKIPHATIESIITRYLGSTRRSGQGLAPPPGERWEVALARTRFGLPRQVFAPGRADIVQDIDGVIANYLSMSFSAPHLYGDRIARFQNDVRAALTECSPTGLFWDWPGDTELVIATKSRS